MGKYSSLVYFKIENHLQIRYTSSSSLVWREHKSKNFLKRDEIRTTDRL